MRASWTPNTEFIEKYFALNSLGGPDGWILDVGCGEGQRRSHFFGKRYVGIDPLLLLPVYEFPFVRGVAEALPFASQTFDVVISIEALDHFASAKSAAAEMVRVLNPGGALLVFVRAKPSNVGVTHSDSTVEPEVITEQAVHTHSFAPSDLKSLFAGDFKQFVVEPQGAYQAAWGWQKRVR